MTFANLAAIHRAMAERLGHRVELRFKKDGLYHDLSWDDVRRRADLAAGGLIALGVKPGDRVAILSENRPEWLIADLAVLSAGAIDVPMHAPLAAKQAAYQFGHSGAVAAIVSDRVQAEKVLASLDDAPDLRLLIAFDSERIDASVNRVGVLSWERLMGEGRRIGLRAEIRARESSLTRDDLATIIYTSGTTGPPKGVTLSHGNLLSNAEACAAISGSEPDDVILSWLPYSHIYARTCDHYTAIVGGATLVLAESLDSLATNLAEIQPSCMASVPRFYEKVWASVAALPFEHRSAALRKFFGGRVRHFSSGGAPLPKHVAEGFHASGLTLMEGYGLTESSPVISFNRIERFRVGSVGVPIPEVEVKIAGDGEILTKGPHVMKGYWRDPEANSRAIVDGWLHTGDVGKIDSGGFLFIIDRKKDILITSGGKNIAPSELERLLVSDPVVDQAVVFGDGKPFVSALIVPNLPALEAKARELGCDVETDGEWIVSKRLHAFLAERIEFVMRDVSKPERVKAFLVLARPFQVDQDELTATLKVRRGHILGKYAKELERLYADETAC